MIAEINLQDEIDDDNASNGKLKRFTGGIMHFKELYGKCQSFDHYNAMN